MDYDSFIERLERDHKFRAIVAESCKCNFERYFETVFFLINGSKVFFKDFHDVLIQKLQSIVEGIAEKRNIGICVPVGSGKSLVVEYFITWCFARSVDCAFCYVSHSDPLINRLSKETRDIIDNPYWTLLFGATLKDDDRQRVNYSFEGAKNRTGLTARSMGSGVTGLDAGNPNVDGFSGALIIDDPIDVGDSKHELARQTCIDTYRRKLATRRRTPTTPSIVIMQRVHQEDLIGDLKEKEAEDWDFVEIPAIDSEGKSFWSERYPVKDLLKIKEVDPFTFFSQYQQSPIAEGGTLIKEEWWQYYDEPVNDIKRRCHAIIMTADTAFGEKTANDFSVVQCWGLTANRMYLLDQIRGQWGYETLLEKVIEFWKKHSYRGKHQEVPAVDRLYIENKASGLSLLGQAKTFRREGVNAFPWDARKFLKDGDKGLDKVARVNQAKLSIYAGKVWLPDDLDLQWVTDFIAECSAFNAEMTHSRDDAVDAMTMAVLLWQGLCEE